MSRNKLASKVCAISARLIGIFFVLCGVLIMPNVSMAMTDSKPDAGGSGEGFAIIGIGGHGYGLNTLRVWLSGNIRIMRADTINNMNFHGVGIFDDRLSPDDMKVAHDIHRQICEAVEVGITSNIPPSDTDGQYMVDCLRSGKLVSYSGLTPQLPSALLDAISAFDTRVTNSYLPESRAVIRLDVEIAGVERKNDKFLVSIRFVNSGQFPIRMATPDKWPKEMGYRLGFGGENEADKSGWGGGNLAGQPLVNQSEFPDGKVVIPAQSSVTFKLLTQPNNKLKRGTYRFNTSVVTAITVPDVSPNMGLVDFHSDYSKPARVAFDTDYPSTPDEWKDYEARQREKMSSQPVRPGAEIAEAGYYRNVSASGERGQFIVGLMRGEKTPTLERPFDRWEWEADLALPARCKPGEPCPREGRWIARTMTMGSGDRDVTHPEFERCLLAGQVAPDLSTLGGMVAYHYWQWLGA